MNSRASYYDIELKEKILVCEYNITNSYKASINGKNLKLPPKQVKRFAVIGDSGYESSFLTKSMKTKTVEI